MDDDEANGGGTLVMEPQGTGRGNPERPGSGPGGEPGRQLPRPPIFQLVNDEPTSVDEPVTRLKADAAPTAAADPNAPFAATQLNPFGSQAGPSPAVGQPQAWPNPALIQADTQSLASVGYPQPPAPHGYPQALIAPRVPDELSHGSSDLASEPRKMVLAPIAVGAAAGLLVTVVVVGAVLIMRDPAPAAPATSSATSSTVAPAPPAPSSHVAPEPPPKTTAEPSAQPVAPTDADGKAQAALGKLKEGIEYCVKSAIHVLPGVSPAVPASLAWLKSGPYESLKRDWASPFFSCTRFKLEEPMPFMIQWQVDEPNLKGMGVAWIDSDGDGVAERAYGFKATLKERDKVEFGAIEPIDKARKLQLAR